MPLKPIKFNDRIKAKEMTPYRAVSIAQRMKSRWPKMEHIILKEPQSAFHYAMWVIKDRWPEAEDVIKKDDSLWRLYKKKFRRAYAP